MSRFFWSEVPVKDRIDAHHHAEERDQLREAYTHLMNSGVTKYGDFVRAHHDFLRRNPNATERQLKHRLQLIEAVGVEHAVWPTLLWRKE